MTANRARKKAARRRVDRDDVSYREARRRLLAGDDPAHRHPAPDLSILADLPYADGRPVDAPLAVAVVGACRAGCRPCQETLIPALLADRATVAALAGAVYGLWPTAGLFASSPTLAWHPLVRQAHESGDGAQAFTALEAMSADELAQLLDDALEHWAAGGADFKPTMLDLEVDDLDDDEQGPVYALIPGMAETPHGPLPLLYLEPEAGPAGADDLLTRCGWPRWDVPLIPGADPVLPSPAPQWRVRVSIAHRAVEQIAHVDDEGWDDIIVGQAPDLVPMSEDWWNLVDRVQHVLLCGPVSADGHASPAEALTAAAAAGPVMAVLAQVSFW